jgi:hypothetical protein
LQTDSAMKYKIISNENGFVVVEQSETPGANTFTTLVDLPILTPLSEIVRMWRGAVNMDDAFNEVTTRGFNKLPTIRDSRVEYAAVSGLKDGFLAGRKGMYSELDVRKAYRSGFDRANVPLLPTENEDECIASLRPTGDRFCEVTIKEGGVTINKIL